MAKRKMTNNDLKTCT